MKGLLCFTAGLLSVSGLAVLASPVQTRTSAAFPSADGLKFKIDDQTKYVGGTNSYWIGFMTNNADVDLVMDHISKSGLKILRVWGFNDVTRKPGAGTVYYQYLSASGAQINTGADGLQRRDYVVSSAEKHGIKLIINFVNNWSDYGGMPAYVTAFGGTKEGWYTNSKAQSQYRAYIKAVVSRYTNSSALFAWELANEPRCKGCSTDVIFNWATDVSKYIKSLDPNHMVTLGDEGFGLPGGDSSTSYPYGTSEGVDFVKNLGIATLDFGTFHMYPQSCELCPMTQPSISTKSASRECSKQLRAGLGQRPWRCLQEGWHAMSIRRMYDAFCPFGAPRISWIYVFG